MTESIFPVNTSDRFSFPEDEKPNLLAQQLLRRIPFGTRPPVVEGKAVQDERMGVYRRDLGLVSNNLAMISDAMGDSAKTLHKAAKVSATQVQAMSNEFSMMAEHMQQTMRQVSESTARSMAGINEQLHAVREKTHEAAHLGLRSRGKIETMVKASDDIGGVVKLIHDIAEQTRMLAMNATIESVRVGEAGAGFRVIANEVKTLAVRTAAATEDISAAIKNMREHSHDATHAALAIVESVEHISNLTDNTTRIAAEVTDHVTDHIAHGTSETNDDLQHMSKGVDASFGYADDVRVIAQKTNREACHLRASIDELSQLTMTHLGEFKETGAEGIELF